MPIAYADDLVTLVQADCLEDLCWLDGQVLITDPPYGTGAHGYGRGRGGIANDLDTELRDLVLAMWGTTRPRLVFASPRLPEPPGTWTDRLVWDKRRPGTNGGPWRYRHEAIYASAGFLRADNSAVSIISAHPGEDQVDHIHAKPLALMGRLVAAAPPGLIVDPFAGSGSTLLAAKQLGRSALGVELDPGYCGLAAARLAQGVLVP